VKEKFLLYPEYKKFVELLENEFKEYYGEKAKMNRKEQQNTGGQHEL